MVDCVWDSVNVHSALVLKRVNKTQWQSNLTNVHHLHLILLETKWSAQQRSGPTCVTWHLAIADLLESLLVGFAVVVDLGLCG